MVLLRTARSGQYAEQSDKWVHLYGVPDVGSVSINIRLPLGIVDFS
jgi:hypothetical protein